MQQLNVLWKYRNWWQSHRNCGLLFAFIMEGKAKFQIEDSAYKGIINFFPGSQTPPLFVSVDPRSKIPQLEQKPTRKVMNWSWHWNGISFLWLSQAWMWTYISGFPASELVECKSDMGPGTIAVLIGVLEPSFSVTHLWASPQSLSWIRLSVWVATQSSL